MFKMQDFFFTFDLKSAYYIENFKEPRAFLSCEFKGKFIIMVLMFCALVYVLQTTY